MPPPATLAGIWTLEGLKLTHQKLVPWAERVGISVGRPNSIILQLVFWGLVSCHLVKNPCITLIDTRSDRNSCCGKNLVMVSVGPGRCSAAFWMGKAVMLLQATVELSKSALTGAVCFDGVSLLPLCSLLKRLGQRMARLCHVPKIMSNPAMSVNIISSIVFRSLLLESCRRIVG